jgi:hypothetical protein
MNNPPASAWLSQIEGARSTAELVRLLRDYLTALSAEERAHLPAACTVDNISNAADIQEWSVTLAREDLKTTGSASVRSGLQHAAVVFAAAGSRLPKVAE